MTYSVNIVTMQGLALIAKATTQNPITFTRVGSKTGYTNAKDAETLTASACDGPWGTIRSVASREQDARIIGQFTNNPTAATVKTIVFFAKSSTGLEEPFAVLSDEYASIYLPGDQSPEAKVLVAFNANIGAGLVVSTPSDAVALADFLTLKDRVVTTHAENDAADGDAQAVRGAKAFEDLVTFGDSGVLFSGGVSASADGADFYVRRTASGGAIIVGNKDACNSCLTTDCEELSYADAPVRTVGISEDTVEGEPVKWVKTTLFGGDTRDAPDAADEGGEVTPHGAFINVGRKNDDERAVIYSWADSERHIINEKGGMFTIEAAENSGQVTSKLFKVTEDYVSSIFGDGSFELSTSGFSAVYDNKQVKYRLSATRGGVAVDATVGSGLSAKHTSSAYLDKNGALIEGYHDDGDYVSVLARNGLFSVSSTISNTETVQINVNHGVLTLPAGIGNLKDVLCNMGSPSVDGLTMIWVELRKGNLNYNAGEEVSTDDDNVILHSHEYFNDEQQAGSVIPSARKYILLHPIRNDSVSRVIPALVIRSN